MEKLILCGGISDGQIITFDVAPERFYVPLKEGASAEITQVEYFRSKKIAQGVWLYREDTSMDEKIEFIVLIDGGIYVSTKFSRKFLESGHREAIKPIIGDMILNAYDLQRAKEKK